MVRSKRSRWLAVRSIGITAKTLKVSRSSVQRAIKVLKKAAPELVDKVDRGRIPASTASKLVVLLQAEQVKIATADNPC